MSNESKIRPQYHLRKTKSGIDAFDVRRLIELTSHLSPFDVDPNSFAELKEDHWYFHSDSSPTPLSIIQHARLMNSCDLSYPIILDSSGRVMDGMHRICKAIINNISTIKAVQFEVDPAPDFRECDPATLSYDA